MEELSNQIKQLHYTNQMDMNVFLNHPDEQQVVYALTEEEIIAGIMQEKDGDNPEDDSTEIQKVSCQEAFSMLDKLESFWLQQEGVYIAELLCTRKLKDVVATEKMKLLCQTTLDKYFTSS